MIGTLIITWNLEDVPAVDLWRECKLKGGVIDCNGTHRMWLPAVPNAVKGLKEMRSRMTQSIDDSCSNGFTNQGHETKPFDDTCCRKKMDVVDSFGG
ncbi:hypothetical protein PIB30_086593 [Stylosanthes scabra]|uniref:Uncharacterized protein n=1 Tax=Stylosanthes scabra TaxID=79078 RepID=A0ABU6ZRT3_9FABA|nr:hypothetical protein [Stylosanthes scabra]